MKVIKFIIVCACAAIAAACNDVEMERLSVAAAHADKQE